MVRRPPLVEIALLAAASLVHVSPCPAAVECHLRTARVARTFYTGETAQLSITTDSDARNVPYEVRNYESQVVASGRVSFTAAEPTELVLRGLANGVYYLQLTFGPGDLYRDQFCVLPPPDQGGEDARLWGFQLNGAEERCYQMLAQVGVRYVRFDVSWPDHEPSPGAYRTSKADWYAGVCRRWGLQMIPTLGYSPSWTAQKPDNMDATRNHTWCPDAVEHWGEYVRLLRERLGRQTVTWPSPELGLGASNATQEVPLVRSWEIWNEVDQNFYYGPWPRYLDLLRVASGVLKQTSRDRRVMYGGACAHWTEMGKTYDCAGPLFFDEVAWHSNKDLETELPKYYYGAPQLGYRNWIPQLTVQTECYPTTRAGVGEAEYLLRLYTVLRAWREEGYCYASIGSHLVGPADPNSIALTSLRSDKEYMPNAKYVAYATSRWLLGNSAYLGPVSLAEGVTAHVFARQGGPMMVLWSDTGATVSVELDTWAQQIDVMGRSRRLPGTECSLTLNGAPTVIWGVAYRYAVEAIQNYFETTMNTEYGFPYATDSPYVKTLAWDCCWRCDGQSDRLLATLRQTLDAMKARPAMKGRALDSLAADISTSTANLCDAAARYRSRYGLRPEVPTSLWRLVRLAEWLGEATDALAGPRCVRASGSDWPPRKAYLMQRLDTLYTQLAETPEGSVHPLALRMLDRGYSLAATYQRTGGAGVLKAALTAADAAEAWGRVENPQVRGVFLVGYFPTARQLKKSTIFTPGQTHTLQVQVYNFTSKPVSGTFTWALGAAWSPNTVTVPFSVGPGQHTERIPCDVTVPGGPEPWSLGRVTLPAGDISVWCPSTTANKEWLQLYGQLSDGRGLPQMVFETAVGVLG